MGIYENIFYMDMGKYILKHKLITNTIHFQNNIAQDSKRFVVEITNNDKVR